MDKELKTPKSYSLHPIIIGWLTQEAAKRTMEEGKSISASEVVNDILFKAMQENNAEEDVAHSKKMVKRNILKQK
jgi:hypothetical protein